MLPKRPLLLFSEAEQKARGAGIPGANRGSTGALGAVGLGSLSHPWDGGIAGCQRHPRQNGGDLCFSKMEKTPV